MNEFEEQLRQMATKNWPLDKLESNFSGIYDQAVRVIEGDGKTKVPGAWRAVYRYEARLKGPEHAIARLVDAEHKIPLNELFQIKEDYFNQSKQPDELERMCHSFIADRQQMGLAYQSLILLYCRSGRLSEAEAILQASVAEDLKGALGSNIRFAHMLGNWDTFGALLSTYTARMPENNLNAIRWLEVQKWVSEPSSRAYPFPHRFINLERAKGRKRALEERYARYGKPLNFVEAVDGTQMSEETYQSWCPTGRLHVGGVANLQSQLSVWRAFLASNDDHILIFEDDAWPYSDMSTWTDLTELVETHDPDMVFLNDRGAGVWWERHREAKWTTYLEAISGYTNEMRAPGLDGYLLSRKGAEKLIDNFTQDRVVTNIDWQTAAYTISRSEGTRMPDGVQRSMITRAHQFMTSTTTLSAFALNRPIVCQFAAGHATVNETNQIAHLARAKPTTPSS